MAWRFRRSTKIGPFRFTATKRGFSTSVGVRGARIGLNSKGQVRATGGIPGTGIYSTEIIGHVGGTSPSHHSAGDAPSDTGADRAEISAAYPAGEAIAPAKRAGLSGKGIVIVIMGVVIMWLVVILVMR